MSVVLVLTAFFGAVLGGALGAAGTRYSILLIWIGVTFGWDGLHRFLRTGSLTPKDKP